MVEVIYGWFGNSCCVIVDINISCVVLKFIFSICGYMLLMLNMV